MLYIRLSETKQRNKYFKNTFKIFMKPILAFGSMQHSSQYISQK